MNTLPELAWHDLQWCLRRCPRQLLEVLQQNAGKMFVAGGYIRACVSGDPINDIDVFCGSSNEAEAAALFLVEGDEKRLWRSDNAITVKGYGHPIQFIHRWTFDTPEQCIESFDFTIARAAFWWQPDGQELVRYPNKVSGDWKSACDANFYPDLAGKRLVYCAPVRNEDAGGSLLRVLKFYQRGYRIPLDSMGAVIARLIQGVDGFDRWDMVDGKPDERRWAKVLTGLLREVDPNVDPSHIAHLPSRNPEATSEEVAR
jgi:hypothetical protein